MEFSPKSSAFYYRFSNSYFLQYITETWLFSGPSHLLQIKTTVVLIHLPMLHPHATSLSYPDSSHWLTVQSTQVRDIFDSKK